MAVNYNFVSTGLLSSHWTEYTKDLGWLNCGMRWTLARLTASLALSWNLVTK